MKAFSEKVESTTMFSRPFVLQAACHLFEGLQDPPLHIAGQQKAKVSVTVHFRTAAMVANSSAQAKNGRRMAINGTPEWCICKDPTRDDRRGKISAEMVRKLRVGVKERLTKCRS